jgi:hypothetical protein
MIAGIFPAQAVINLLIITCGLALGFTQPPKHWIPGVKRLEGKTDHSSPFITEVKNA